MRAKTFKTKKTISIVLTNAVDAVRGETACLDTATGLLVAAGTSATLLPLGYFTQDMTGDGVAKAVVELFEEMRLDYFDNDDAPNNVVATDIGNDVFIKDGSTVSALGTGRSVAGRVFDVDPIDGVGVRMLTA